MSIRLSHGQAEIVSLASKGHNLFLTGQGGTGKSTVVREIISNRQAVGKKGFRGVFQWHSMHSVRSWSCPHRAFLLMVHSGDGVSNVH